MFSGSEADGEIRVRVDPVGLVAGMVGQGERRSCGGDAPFDQVLPAGQQSDAHERIGEAVRSLIEPFAVTQL